MTESKEVDQEVTGAVGKPILARVIKQGFLKEVPFHLRPEGTKGDCHVNSWR